MALKWRTSLSLGGAALLAACFSDSAPASTGAGGSTDGPVCPQGSGGCPCYGNGTCDSTFVCDIPLQLCVSETCVDGRLGCPCDAGACEADLVCEAGLCAAATGDDTAGADTTSTGRDETTSAVTTDATTTPADSTSQDTGAGPSDPTQVVLFFSSPDDATTFGPSELSDDFRELADGMCTSSIANLDTPCTRAVGVVSVGEVDSVAALQDLHEAPFGVPVVSDSGDVIADSFATLLAMGVSQPLVVSNVTYAGQPGAWPATYLTGTLPGGDLDAANSCLEWSEDVDGQAVLGSVNEPGTGWLASTQLVGCMTAQTELLCLCWE